MKVIHSQIHFFKCTACFLLVFTYFSFIFQIFSIFCSRIANQACSFRPLVGIHRVLSYLVSPNDAWLVFEVLAVWWLLSAHVFPELSISITSPVPVLFSQDWRHVLLYMKKSYRHGQKDLHSLKIWLYESELKTQLIENWVNWGLTQLRTKSDLSYTSTESS